MMRQSRSNVAAQALLTNQMRSVCLRLQAICFRLEELLNHLVDDTAKQLCERLPLLPGHVGTKIDNNILDYEFGRLCESRLRANERMNE